MTRQHKLCVLGKYGEQFMSDNEYRVFAEKFQKEVKPEMDKLQEARRQSIIDSLTHKVDQLLTFGLPLNNAHFSDDTSKYTKYRTKASPVGIKYM